MLNLTRVIDRATGYVFIPPPDAKPPEGAIDTSHLAAAAQPNSFSLFTSAVSTIPGLRTDVRDVQERWIDAKEEWDAYEKAQWRLEGEKVRDEAARRKKEQMDTS